MDSPEGKNVSIGKRRVAMVVTAAVDGAVVALAAPDYALAGNIFLILLMIKSAVFVALYWFRSNWRATTAGQAVMALVACIATICAIGIVNLYFGSYPGRPFVRLFAFAAVGLTLMNLLLALIEAQRNGGENP